MDKQQLYFLVNSCGKCWSCGEDGEGFWSIWKTQAWTYSEYQIEMILKDNPNKGWGKIKAE